MTKRLSLFKLLVIGLAFIGLIAVGSVVLTGLATTSDYPNQCSVAEGKLPDRVPAKLGAVFTQAAEEYDIQPYVLALVYYNENGHYREPPPPYGNGPRWPVSYKGARGPFQFMSGTWRAYRNSNPAHRPGNVNDLVDAAYAAAHYLKAELRLKANSAFGSVSNPKKGTVTWALGAYNAGPYSGFENWGLPYIKRAAKEYSSYFANAKGGSTLASTMIKVCDEPKPSQNGPVVDPPSTKSTVCPSGVHARQLRVGNGGYIRVCRVNGITVNAKIAHKWAYLVAKARKEGINLTGGGFRTASQQITLRRQHCGTSHYAIYQMPASACSPDTARPGTSFHELGLAVDLNMTRAVYRFMQKHGPPIGIYRTVPSEWWHWSTRTRNPR